MNENRYIYVNIYLQNLGFIPCGVITYNNNVNASSFSYFNSYMEKNFPAINPATLNYKTTKQKHFITKYEQNKDILDKTFWELIPNENDWADSVLNERYEEYESMNKLEKLFFLGTREVGGLASYTEEQESEINIESINWLDKVRDQSINFYLRNLEKITYIKAIKPLTGYGGIRPKCMFQDDHNDFWIAKFNLPNDKYDMAKFEKTSLDMAKDIGVNIANSKVLTLPSGETTFLSKRFDRVDDSRYHSLSIFSLLEPKKQIEKNYHGNSTTKILDTIHKYSDYKDKDTEILIKKIIIDIALNNTDNHMRNMRLILNKEHKWELSPFYDIVTNHYRQNHVYNPIEENKEEIYLTNPNLSTIISQRYNVDKFKVERIINKAIETVENWEYYCDKNNMTYDDKLLFLEGMKIGLGNNLLKIKEKKQIVQVKNTLKLQKK